MKLISKLKNIFTLKTHSYNNSDFMRSEETKISFDINNNHSVLKNMMDKCDDVVYRKLTVGKSDIPLLIAYIDSMTDIERLNSDILKPLMEKRNWESEKNNIDTKIIMEKVLAVSQIKESNSLNELVDSLLDGHTILFINGSKTALAIANKSKESRSISESVSERTVRGSQESFVEAIEKNINLIRSRIQSPKLAVEVLKMGENTSTKVALLYMHEISKKNLVDDLRCKLKNIKSNAILASAQVEQIIEDHKWSVFPQIMATDRPDKLAGSLLEGRAVIIVDGTPYALIAPVTFAMFLNSSDDYFDRSIITTFIRLMRYLCYLIASTFPALYISLTSFHPGMLPTPLALYITGTRVGLPFPSFVEILFMQLALEVLVEAAVRLPKAIGQTVGIVGGLVLGQAVVIAGLVTPIIVIVVAITALSTFVLPGFTFAQSNRVVRVFLIIGAAFFGLYGIVMGWLFILIHLASMESFGVRYLEDFSPYKLSKLKDTFVKVPYHLMNDIPEYLKNDEQVRQTCKKRSS